MEASVSTTDTGTPAAAPPPASPEQVHERATQLVDQANERGDLKLSADDRKAIVDQVVAAIGPLIGALSEEDVNRVVDQMIERMAELGAFSPAPGAASGAGNPAPAPEVAAEAAAEVAATQAPPEKLTWAEKNFPNR